MKPTTTHWAFTGSGSGWIENSTGETNSPKHFEISISSIILKVWGFALPLFSQLSHRFSKWIYKCTGGFLEFSVSSGALSWAWNAYVLLRWRLNKQIILYVKHIWTLQTRLSNDSAASCVKEVECCEVLSPQSCKCTQQWSILPRLLLWFPL